MKLEDLERGIGTLWLDKLEIKIDGVIGGYSPVVLLVSTRSELLIIIEDGD